MSQTEEIYCSDGSKPIYQHHPVAAVIGAASSQVSVMVASMLQLFKVPQISYSSTGAELSEKPRFAYFSRVVPPDNLQATAMAHIVSALGWTYVHAIAVTGAYGERGIDSFRTVAAELGVCIDGDVYKINRRWTDIQFNNNSDNNNDNNNSNDLDMKSYQKGMVYNNNNNNNSYNYPGIT
ncbi:Metabotropic glutamate receptor 8 [Dirofilaria immitis]|nr:Metabotropic glutamate receptor 8 [Dirofilaria immitis]